MSHRNTDAIIRIKNLRLRTFVGIKEEEINNKQDIVINVEIHYPAERSRDSEDINDALNYRTITKNIIRHVEENRFALLEKLTQDVLDIASNHDWITYAEVEVDKLFALRYADSVSVSMRYYKESRYHQA
ncbi:MULTISPECIES: dihydroneopterin triphosphate 2'-epimerase [unclassified Brenneria]|uniref:dihydroneopterin triphosphate 2'-epimerase n=1 Tax=unclassified Brenneria TaxID=2634434 RepID=UPI0029C25AE2|nr:MULTISPECIES: dihydroneopterin triphosphate 2'-epimerase [unclassified Brenneria]MDX5629240.1 dihydroneopterin triphosphate 2'-epimerase [Brenneria sp. L3-3Z]MDX5696379.1 dihydroneopterin triphosphate 2'-epimerase [Brenneria sp. L4-2C]MEE3662754.1 dihydroneopterin triphosphate 2'-epimerase [Brenneria sp. g21c3]